MEKKELIEIINLVMDAREATKPQDIIGKLESDQLDQLAPALAKLQANVKTLSPNRQNTYAKNHYADLDAILTEAKPLLEKYGFSVVPRELTNNGIKCLKTMLVHASGQFIASFVELIITENMKRKSPIQDYGTALTYHKRYSIASLLGITAAKDPLDNDDEDIQAQGATQVEKSSQKKEKQLVEPQPEIKKDCLAAAEVEYINDILHNHDDIKKALLGFLKMDKIENIYKDLFDVTVKFIDSHVEKKILP